jgi:hypothetical protein
MWEPRRLTNLWAFTACYRDSFTFFLCPTGPIYSTKILLRILHTALDLIISCRYNLLTYLIRSSYTLWRRGLFFILITLQTVGLLGRVISSSQGLYLNTRQHKHRINIHTHTKHPCLMLDSNPQSRLPSEQRQYMP